MKEDIKNVLLMGLGAISLTGEKASEIKKELLEKGEALYKEGSIKNEELKRDIKEKILKTALHHAISHDKEIVDKKDVEYALKASKIKNSEVKGMFE